MFPSDIKEHVKFHVQKNKPNTIIKTQKQRSFFDVRPATMLLDLEIKFWLLVLVQNINYALGLIVGKPFHFAVNSIKK